MHKCTYMSTHTHTRTRTRTRTLAFWLGGWRGREGEQRCPVRVWSPIPTTRARHEATILCHIINPEGDVQPVKGAVAKQPGCRGVERERVTQELILHHAFECDDVINRPHVSRYVESSSKLPHRGGHCYIHARVEGGGTAPRCTAPPVSSSPIEHVFGMDALWCSCFDTRRPCSRSPALSPPFSPRQT